MFIFAAEIFDIMKKIFSLTLLLLAAFFSAAQAQVNFSVEYKRVSPTEIDIIFKGTAEPGWHVYSTDMPADGPQAATFAVDEATGAKPVGALKKGGKEISQHDPIFGMEVRFFEGTCSFTQIGRAHV